MDYPKSVPGIGLVNGKFVNEDVVGGLPGSLIPATWGNSVTDELLNVVKSAGLEPSENDATQLLQAIRKISQAGEDKHAADIGAANLYMANYVPAITTLKDGLALRFTAGNANTGASTFAPNGLLPKPLLSLAQSALRPAEIVGGSVCSVVFSAALDSWLLVYASGGNATTGRLLGVRTFAASGVYVPSVGMKNAWVKVIGGGGGSAGIPATGSNQISMAGGGASGGYAEAWLASAAIGSSQTITVGSGGAGGAVAEGGGGGGTSSFGSLVSATGGGGSPGFPALPLPSFGLYTGGYPSLAPSGGNIVNMAGAAGSPGICLNGSVLAGHGGNSPLGSGGYGSSAANALAAPGSGYGSGGGGIANANNQAARPGGAGARGVVIIYEYA
ncbi:glycine-rich domain-containing protein [Pseudomonas fitomaticsae]